MKTNNQTLTICINLGYYLNELIPGTHYYHNLIPDAKISAASVTDMGGHEFTVNYHRVTRKQIREAIQTGFDIITPITNMDYAYGDLIKQILAFISLAHHLNLINDQEAQTYLDKLQQIDETYFFQEPEANDLDIEIALGTMEITPDPLNTTYTISIKW